MTNTPAPPSTIREAELLELIDDLAAILQNPDYYGLEYSQAMCPGTEFTTRALARLAEISPAPITPKET